MGGIRECLYADGRLQEREKIAAWEGSREQRAPSQGHPATRRRPRGAQVQELRFGRRSLRKFLLMVSDEQGLQPGEGRRCAEEGGEGAGV